MARFCRGGGHRVGIILRKFYQKNAQNLISGKMGVRFFSLVLHDRPKSGTFWQCCWKVILARFFQGKHGMASDEGRIPFGVVGPCKRSLPTPNSQLPIARSRQLSGWGRCVQAALRRSAVWEHLDEGPGARLPPRRGPRQPDCDGLHCDVAQAVERGWARGTAKLARPSSS